MFSQMTTDASKVLRVLAGVLVLVVPLALMPAAAGANSGLVGQWRLDDGAATLVDSSGGNVNGTLFDVSQNPTAGTWGIGISGAALDFAGPYQWASFPQAFPFHNVGGSVGDATLVFWVRAIDGNHRTLFWTGQGPYGPDANRFHIYSGLVFTGGPGIGVDYRSEDGGLRVLFEQPIPLGEWVQVALTRAADTYVLYLNGSVVSTTIVPTGDLPTWVTDWKIGRMDGGFGGFAFNGQLDEISLWSRSLTSAEVAAQYALFTAEPLTAAGFFQPVDMGGVLNTVKAGATVPLKFELFQGTSEVVDPAVVTGFTATSVSCTATDTAGADAIEFTTTGATSLRYDAVAGQFVQNWKTPKVPGCYRVGLIVGDTAVLTALFQLR